MLVFRGVTLKKWHEDSNIFLGMIYKNTLSARVALADCKWRCIPAVSPASMASRLAKVGQGCNPKQKQPTKQLVLGMYPSSSSTSTNPTIVFYSWWFFTNPSEKYVRPKWLHLPQIIRGENIKKDLSCHHQDFSIEVRRLNANQHDKIPVFDGFFLETLS